MKNFFSLRMGSSRKRLNGLEIRRQSQVLVTADGTEATNHFVSVLTAHIFYTKPVKT